MVYKPQAQRVFTVIGDRSFGRHGADRKWFGQMEDAQAYAEDLLSNSQIGRGRPSSRLKPLKLFVVEAVHVVETCERPVIRRRLAPDDVAVVFYKRGLINGSAIAG